MDERQGRHRAQLARRREVLALPMIALRHHAYLVPSSDDAYWRREPRAVGIGPGGEAVALWDHHAGHGRLLTRHGSSISGRAEARLSGARAATFVQPLPDGHVLLVDARSQHGGSRGGETAEVRDESGAWVRSGHLGDAVEHVLTTPAGNIWVGYFDEAAATGRGLGGHGLVRFGPDLLPQWLYPFNGGLPRIDDCYALNVSEEAAYAFVYNANHLVSVCGEQAVDHGKTPRAGAHAVLVDGDHAMLIGGYGADYDLVTPVRISHDGLEVAGPLARLVMPDGMELHGARFFCRGPELHVVTQSSWYRASINDFHTES
jgi:hypothetical protein